MNGHVKQAADKFAEAAMRTSVDAEAPLLAYPSVVR